MFSNQRADYLIEQALGGLLLENRLEFLAGKYKGMDFSHDTLAHHKEIPAIIDHFADKADPTKKKKFTDHILRWYSKGHIRQEDHPRIHKALKGFETNKASLTQKDLGQYKTFQELEDTVSKLSPSSEVKTPWAKITKTQKSSVESGSKIIHDDDTHVVRKVNSHEAMKVLGSKTKWCVVPSDDYFHSYRELSPLFHVHDKKTDERFLVHDHSDQYMDVNDSPVSIDTLESKYTGLQLRHDHGDFKYDPKTHTRKDLDNVISTGSTWDKANLAGDEDVSPDFLHKLSGTGHPKIDKSLIQNRKTPSHSLSNIVVTLKSAIKPDYNVGNVSQRIAPYSVSERLENIARHGNASKELLHHLSTDEALAGDLGWEATGRIHAGVARNRNTSVETLHHLGTESKSTNSGIAGRPSIDVTNALVDNPRTSAGTLHQMVVDGGSTVAARVASRASGVLPETYEEIANRDEHAHFALPNLARNPSIPLSLADKLSSSKHDHVRRELPSNPVVKSNKQLMQKLAGDQNDIVRNEVALNSARYDDILNKLSDDEHADVRTSVAKTIHLGTKNFHEIASKFASSGHITTMRELSRNPHVDGNILSKIHGSLKDVATKYEKIFKDRGVPPEQHFLYRDPDSVYHGSPAEGEAAGIYSYLANHPNTPEHVIRDLSSHHHPNVRRAVARSKADMPADVVRKLKNDDHHAVRFAMTGNKHRKRLALD